MSETGETIREEAPQRGGDLLARWRERLAAVPVVLDLPTDRPRGAARVRRHEGRALVPGPGLSTALAGASEATPGPAHLAAAFQLLMHRYGGQEQVVTGVSTGGGGPLVVATDFRGRPTGAEVLERVERALAHARRDALPLAELLTALRPDSDASFHPLFQVGLVWTESSAQQASDGLDSDALDLVLRATRGDGGSLSIDYDADLFDADTIDRMGAHLEQLAAGLVREPHTTARRLPLLTEPERALILERWNDTRAEFPDDACLHDLFERNAAARPDATAVIAEGATLTYDVLARRAHQLAHHLRSKGVGPEVRVGLCVERSVDLVVGILGILEAGGAYVPLDPEYPADRVAFMLGDSKVSVLVTQERLVDELPAQAAQVVRLDGDAAAIAARSDDAPETGVRPDNLAYVIYTSGSTGRPKGIALRHQGVVNNLHDLNHSFGVGPTDRVLAISAASFDMCVYEVLGTLAAGGAIVVPEGASAKDPASLAELVVRHGVSVWNSAPALLEMFVDYVEGRPELRPTSLRVAIQGGDWEPVSLPDRLKALAPGVRVIVLGGATEASIHSIVYPVESTDPTWASIPYGVPMRNQRAYLLDAELEPVPLGVPGELYLGGIGLARGYFERPELTAERFLPDPFSGAPGARIYRTGDLARWMRDGNIELLGRLDHQVKIRGHRIELGEIAAVLRSSVSVNEAVVTARQDDSSFKTLVAYVVPNPDAAISEASDGADEGQAEQVDHWQKVYDDTYSQAAPSGDATQNFIGWHSSYTGQPFPDEELQELLGGTLDAIHSLSPDRVLEIGCGSGLILFPLAAECSRYDGRDVSPVVVERLTRILAEPERELGHVSVTSRSAEDFEGVEAGAYDTIVINSVSQHFPTIDYFVSVIEGAARVVQPGGAIFVGDVRSLPQLETFCAGLEAYGVGLGSTVAEQREQVRKRLWQEKELFVDPTFFAALRDHVPEITRVEIRLKRGRFHNEMNKFHYDAFLYVEGEPAPASSTVDWEPWREGDGAQELRARLVADSPDLLALTGVPNARALPEVEALRALREGDGARPFQPDSTPSTPGVDPHDLWSLADALDYEAAVSWSPDDIGRMDVLLRRRTAAGPLPCFALEEVPLRNWLRYSNDPMQSTTAQRLTPILRTYLDQRLPEYMVPGAFVFLRELPLSPNGKLDRKALPAPVLARAVEGDYEAPRNDVDRVLVAIWSEALGVERVGVRDDFFQLGGHSLTAAKVVSRARDAFQVEIPLRTLFEQPTVAGWASVIASAGNQAGVDVAEIAEALIQIEDLSEEEIRDLLGTDPSN